MMHEQKQGSCRPEDNGGGDHTSRHRAGVTTAPEILNSAQRNLFIRNGLRGINIDVEFPAPGHARLGCASVIVPIATVPCRMTTKSPTLTSSTTSNRQGSSERGNSRATMR